MSIIQRKQGELLRLRAFIKNEIQAPIFVKAFLKDPDGSTHSTPEVELSELYSGAYGENTLTMPNQASLEVRYEVYRDAAFTQRALEYPECTDVYEIELGASTGSSGVDYSSIRGEIDSRNITACFEQGTLDAITSSMDSDNIIGKVYDGDDITAEIQQNKTIIGVIDEC